MSKPKDQPSAESAPANKGGRPSSYKPEYAEQGTKLCALGATTPELADFFGVATSTVDKWIADIPAFSDAIKAAKESLDARVERRLFERAMGYEHPEVDIRVVGQEIVQTPIRKVYAPDTTAAIFWLKNRRSAQWRDIKAVELSGNNGGPIVMAATSLDEKL